MDTLLGRERVKETSMRKALVMTTAVALMGLGLVWIPTADAG